MDYHEKNISKYGVLQMSTYGFAFKKIKEIWSHLKDEPYNLRFSLTADGVNPFGNIRSTYLTWLVFVINNNIPPLISINREHIMLEMMVLGICLQSFFQHSIISFVFFAS